MWVNPRFETDSLSWLPLTAGIGLHQVQTCKPSRRLLPRICWARPIGGLSLSFFSDKITIITGAASGIGYALSRELARRGAVVVMADKNADLLFASVASIIGDGFRVVAAQLDVTDHAAVKKLVDDTVATHGRLDYLFNNAGIVIVGEARDFSMDDWHTVINTNLYGVVNGVAAAYPLMVKQGFGHIVNTASLAGLAPLTGQIPYTTSKYAVVGLSNALRIEGADLGVKVSVVCPGLIDTPILKTVRVINMDREKFFSMMPGRMAPDKCAGEILRGVEKNKAIILVTGLVKSSWLIQRFSPGLMRWIWRGVMRKARKTRIEK